MAGKFRRFTTEVASPQNIMNTVTAFALLIVGAYAIIVVADLLLPQTIVKFGNMLGNLSLIQTSSPIVNGFLGAGTIILAIAGVFYLIFLPMKFFTTKSGGTS